ncbi:hypothetical protein GCM10009677_28730 [Sphaerisporangium rubeum]
MDGRNQISTMLRRPRQMLTIPSTAASKLTQAAIMSMPRAGSATRAVDIVSQTGKRTVLKDGDYTRADMPPPTTAVTMRAAPINPLFRALRDSGRPRNSSLNRNAGASAGWPSLTSTAAEPARVAGAAAWSSAG